MRSKADIKSTPQNQKKKKWKKSKVENGYAHGHGEVSANSPGNPWSQSCTLSKNSCCCPAPAPLKLRPSGAAQICLLLLVLLTHSNSLWDDKTERVVDVWQKDSDVDTRHQSRSAVDDAKLLHQCFAGFRRWAIAFSCVRPLLQHYFFVFRSDNKTVTSCRVTRYVVRQFSAQCVSFISHCRFV